jgi:hypothetical protein
LLPGAFEAGFFPGIIFYLIPWFPAVYRARVVSFRREGHESHCRSRFFDPALSKTNLNMLV